MLSIIVTVDKNWAISNNHKPLITIPDDVKFIRDTTYGQVVILGRHTFENIFNSTPMPNRITIVVTKEPDYDGKGAVVVQNATQAILAAEKYNKNTYILGGRKLFKDLLPICDEVHVTSVEYVYSADAFFPNLDKKPEWVMVGQSEEQTHFDVVYYFKKYMRRKDFAG